MFVRVNSQELIGKDFLETNLYDPAGTLVLMAGETLTEKHWESFKINDPVLFKNAMEIAVTPETAETPKDFLDHEGALLLTFDELTDEDRAQRAREDAVEGNFFDDELSNSFISSINYFWKRLERGATPDIALCEVVSEKMVAEVTEKADQIHYLSQIRVRDKFTYSHILDVTTLSIALATKAGFNDKEIKEIALAAILHDTGKLFIPKHIMFKPGRLTEKEFMVMKLHPELGYNVLVNELNIPQHIALPALEHQEMYGGGGYPKNISGNEIHPYSHIVKIADVYDALTSKRPYKDAIPSTKAIEIMLSEGDKSFNPEFLAMFVELSNYQDFKGTTVNPYSTRASA